jgi:hypothetical protein
VSIENIFRTRGQGNVSAVEQVLRMQKALGQSLAPKNKVRVIFHESKRQK